MADLLVMPTMLPSAPKSLGRLSDVFVSALGAITGKGNRLGFQSARSACVVLVDGLGSANLRAAGGHAPFLNSQLAVSKNISTVFPSTTAAALTSFGTGKLPGAHGVLGYSIFDRAASLVRNMLSGWNADYEPKDLRVTETVAQLARKSDVRCFAVGPSDYEGSGFTELSMNGVEYISVSNHDEGLNEVLGLLKAKPRSLIYWYFPELDQAAHAYGVASDIWLRRLETVDATIKSLNASLPIDAGVIVTADHGIVDVPSSNQIMLDEYTIGGLVSVTGDPRNTFLYFDGEPSTLTAATELRDKLAGRVIVATAEEVVSKGWYGDSEVLDLGIMPDLFLISERDFACYHRGFAKPQSLKMVGQHGSISTEELSVPLIKLGKFANPRS